MAIQIELVRKETVPPAIRWGNAVLLTVLIFSIAGAGTIPMYLLAGGFFSPLPLLFALLVSCLITGALVRLELKMATGETAKPLPDDPRD